MNIGASRRRRYAAPQPVGVAVVGSTAWVLRLRGRATGFEPLPVEGYTVASAIIRGGGWREARVPAWCDCCGDPLGPGDYYLDTGVRQGREITRYKLCITCAYRRKA